MPQGEKGKDIKQLKAYDVIGVVKSGYLAAVKS